MATVASPVSGSAEFLNPSQGGMDLYQRILALNDLAASINAARDVDQIQCYLASALDEWRPQVSSRLCIVEGSSYRRIHLSGPATFGKEGTFPLEHGLVGNVLKSAEPLCISDTSTARKMISSLGDITVESFPRSIMVFPLKILGRIVGVLEISSSQPDRFDQHDFHLVLLIAAHLASSLDNIVTKNELANAHDQLREHGTRLAELNQQLQQLAHTDDLTGLFNKRRLFEQLDAEIARVRRYGEILSCLMIDIDHFKHINDSFGHQAGDDVLRQIGALLQHSTRATDFVSRYGGEEFTILLPRTDLAGAYRLAENLRANVSANAFVLPSTDIHLTVSIGIASCTKFDHRDGYPLVQQADQALYKAKRTGRDRVCFADQAGELLKSRFCQSS